MPDTATDRVVLITGATGPLGRAAAAAFAADGARIGLVGRDARRLDQLAAELDLPAGRWAAGAGDLRDAAAAGSAIAAVTDRLGPVDVLLHLVGGWTGGTPLVDLESDVLDGMLGQHVWSTYQVARLVVPAMQARGWGRIVAVTSTAVATAAPGQTAYATAKAGQEAMLRGLAREVAADGITVNLLAVGTIDADHRRESDPSPKHAAWTTPEELVAAIRFLCSDAAAAITGARLAMDGRR